MNAKQAKARRKRWFRNRLRIQRRLEELDRTRRFNVAIDKLFENVGRVNLD